MFASLFQEYGFHTVPFDETFFMSILHGPSSMSNPIADEQPGPRSVNNVSCHEKPHVCSILTSINPHHHVVWSIELILNYEK